MNDGLSQRICNYLKGRRQAVSLKSLENELCRQLNVQELDKATKLEILMNPRISIKNEEVEGFQPLKVTIFWEARLNIQSWGKYKFYENLFLQ